MDYLLSPCSDLPSCWLVDHYCLLPSNPRHLNNVVGQHQKIQDIFQEPGRLVWDSQLLLEQKSSQLQQLLLQALQSVQPGDPAR